MLEDRCASPGHSELGVVLADHQHQRRVAGAARRPRRSSAVTGVSPSFASTASASSSASPSASGSNITIVSSNRRAVVLAADLEARRLDDLVGDLGGQAGDRLDGGGPSIWVALRTATSVFFSFCARPRARHRRPCRRRRRSGRSRWSAPPPRPRRGEHGEQVARVDRQSSIESRVAGGKPGADPVRPTARPPGSAAASGFATSSSAAASPRASARGRRRRRRPRSPRSGARPAHSRSRRTSRACWKIRKARTARPRKAAMPR